MSVFRKKYFKVFIIAALLLSMTILFEHHSRASTTDRATGHSSAALKGSGRTAAFSTAAYGTAAAAADMTAQRLVAHACGAYNGVTYTNSLNALNANYSKGFRLFEIDFNLTSDGKIVLLHDWCGTAKKLLGTGGQAFTYKTFKSLRAVGHITLIDIDTLASWLNAHRDAYVVTDCKAGNLNMLRAISSKYPFLTQRLYPQMGPFAEYGILRQMGYKNIILALYRTNYSDADVLKFVRNHELLAVSMWASRAQTGLARELRTLNIKVYAHTVNSRAQYGYLLKNGVYGIYTDTMAPLVKA